VGWFGGGKPKPRKYKCHIQVWNGKRYKKCGRKYTSIAQFERHLDRGHGGRGRER
jgi:hypothetical protein